MHSFPIYFLFAEKSVDLCAPVVCDIFLLLLHTCRRQVSGREGKVYFYRENGVDCLEFMTRSRGCCTADGLYHGLRRRIILA